MRRIRVALGVLAAATALGLGACSSGTAGGTDSGGDTGSGSIAVTDTTGTVHLKKPATKVVSLEWSYTEDLLGLGVTPVGMADKKTYSDWVAGGPKLPSDVTGVGSRAQPSLEKVKALSPDLIIAEKSRSSANLSQLKRIAPVLLFDAYSPADALVKTVNGNFTQIAKAVGKQGKAKRVLAGYHKKVTDAKKRLADAGKDGTKITLLQGFTVDGQPSIRAYTNHSQAIQVLESIGLTNAWHGKDSDPSGFTSTSVEGLNQVSGATVLSVAQANDNVFAGALAHNATWRNLGFVKQHRMHDLAPDTWFWGGPASDGLLIDRTLKTLGA